MARTPDIELAGMRSPNQRQAGPKPVLPVCRPWELHDTTTSRAIEARALAAEPHGALMRRAGQSVARWVVALAPHAQRIWLACGPGGNGGDGLHAAAMLARQRRHVMVSLHGDAQRLPADAAAGLRVALDAGVAVTDRAPAAAGLDAAVDALLGLGASRPPAGAVLDGVLALQRVRAPVLAIDLPTGLHAETGACLGEQAVRVRATLSLLTLKPGLFTGQGRELAGEIWFDDLGVTATVPERPSALLYAPATATGHASVSHGAHKGSFGDTVVIGGAPGMAGALDLAAQAALGAGSGRTIAVPLDATAPLRHEGRPEVLWRPAASLAEPGWWETATVVCGCGGDEAVATQLPLLLRRAGRLVLDADALNAVSRDGRLREMLRARAGRGLATVLTPHPLEAARLLDCITAEVQVDRLRAASELARELQATIVLKGSGTVICTPGQMTGINGTGGPALASGGTGDVLAGWLGGRWSRRRTEGLPAQELAHAVAQEAVWLHGRAADPADGAVGTARAQDLIEHMRQQATKRALP
jgi:hydroxyethylthiazole kinase-like uncharacterized protein yjeF